MKYLMTVFALLLGGCAHMNPAPSGHAKSSNMEMPYYPVQAQAMRIEGAIKVRFDVLADGSTDNVKIVSAQPEKIFNNETLRAVKRWQLAPGKPETGLVKVIVFRLNGGAQYEQ